MAIKFASIDSTVSLLFAFFINAAILILAAVTFHGTEHAGVTDISDAYNLLTPLLGATFASIAFGIALLASGQSSTLTGTLAGQIVMEGFLEIRLPRWMIRVITRGLAIIPAVIVAVLYGDRGTGELLVLSQVILALQLGFAVVPLVTFTSDKTKMGKFVNPLWLTALAWGITAIIISLNVYLVVQTIFG
jgi:manganese transport protein